MKRILVSGFVALATMTVSTTVEAREPDHVCYMRTSSGQVVNLGKLCGEGNMVVPVNTRSTARPAAQTLPEPDGEKKVSEGRGNGYIFEIWTNQYNKGYELRVWEVARYPDGSPWRYSTKSVGEAHDTFGCNYEDKKLPSCPAYVTRSAE